MATPKTAAGALFKSAAQATASRNPARIAGVLAKIDKVTLNHANNLQADILKAATTGSRQVQAVVRDSIKHVAYDGPPIELATIVPGAKGPMRSFGVELRDNTSFVFLATTSGKKTPGGLVLEFSPTNLTPEQHHALMLSVTKAAADGVQAAMMGVKRAAK